MKKRLILITLITLLMLPSIYAADDFAYNRLFEGVAFPEFDNNTAFVNNSEFCGGVLCTAYARLDGSNTPFTGDITFSQDVTVDMNFIARTYRTTGPGNLGFNFYDDGTDIFMNVSNGGGDFAIEQENTKIILFNQPNSANDFKVFQVFSKEAGDVSEFVITKAGLGNTDYHRRSLSVGVDSFNCSTFANFIACDTGISGGDLYVADDIEINGSIYLSNGFFNVSDDGNVSAINFVTNGTGDFFPEIGSLSFDSDLNTAGVWKMWPGTTGRFDGYLKMGVDPTDTNDFDWAWASSGSAIPQQNFMIKDGKSIGSETLSAQVYWIPWTGTKGILSIKDELNFEGYYTDGGLQFRQIGGINITGPIAGHYWNIIPRLILDNGADIMGTINATEINATGNITADHFFGNGENLTNVNDSTKLPLDGSGVMTGDIFTGGNEIDFGASGSIRDIDGIVFDGAGGFITDFFGKRDVVDFLSNDRAATITETFTFNALIEMGAATGIRYSGIFGGIDTYAFGIWSHSLLSGQERWTFGFGGQTPLVLNASGIFVNPLSDAVSGFTVNTDTSRAIFIDPSAETLDFGVDTFMGVDNLKFYQGASDDVSRFVNSTGNYLQSEVGSNINFISLFIKTIFDHNVQILGNLTVNGTVFAEAVNISNSTFFFGDNENRSIDFTIQNFNNGTNASSILSIRNDVGGIAGVGIASSNFLLNGVLTANATGLFSSSKGPTLFLNTFDGPFLWYNNPQDDNDLSNIELVMTQDNGNLNISGNFTHNGTITFPHFTEPSAIPDHVLMWCEDDNRCFLREDDGDKRRILTSASGSDVIDYIIDFDVSPTMIFMNDTFIGGSAYVCIWDNGSLYSSEVGC